jgi:hypothetical protein
MIENNPAPLLQKTAVIWSHRREREIALRIYYHMCEQDGCKIYTLNRMEEL